MPDLNGVHLFSAVLFAVAVIYLPWEDLWRR